MKTKYLIFSLLACVLLLGGCAKNEFDIEIALKSNVSRVYSLMYYASDKHKGWMTETAVTVTAGKGQTRCITRNPTLVWINPGGGGVQMAIWAERGDKIVITGDDADPLTWTVGGNDINEEWSKWRKDNIQALRSRDSKKINSAVAKYVKGHTGDRLAALLMLTTYVRADNEKEFGALWNSIDSKVKSTELLTAVGRADVMTAAPIDPPLKVVSYRLHCEGDTVVNVSTVKYDASVIYFWTGDENGRNADIDSLRRLSREDHAGRLLDVTDIALTQDSMSWLNKARMDSVDNLKWRRGWAPGGRLNASIQAFAVPESPWFVVLDAKGNQVYTGARSGEALKTARMLLRKAPARKKETPADTTSNKAVK